MKKLIVFLGVILMIGIIYINLSEPAKAEAQLAYDNKMKWNASSILKHSNAYVDEAVKILKEYEHKIDSKLFELESRQIEAQQSLKSHKFNHEHIVSKKEDFVNEYKMLASSGNKENASRLKQLKSKILRLDSKTSSILKRIDLQTSSIKRTDEMIDQTYATQSAVEAKQSEIDLIAVELQLNGSSVTDKIDIERISSLLANVEQLSSHYEYKQLDVLPEVGFMSLDRDQRFLEIVTESGITESERNNVK
ncbi:hypothetical protein N9T10_01330 [Pseudomonadota bacterium]|nr:hypothetical protein [Pseudomonadota bacterium]